MIKRIPVIPTLLVLAAVAVMVRLGFWQLDRLHQKEAMLARYAEAQTTSVEVAWPRNPEEAAKVLYRRSRVVCRDVAEDMPTTGRNAAGEVGWAHVFQCKTFVGEDVPVVLGWSQDPGARIFRGGRGAGVIGPGPRLIVDPDLSEFAKLLPNARPDPADIPNNHLSYAVQWFLFALTALVIYGLALRKRLAA